MLLGTSLAQEPAPSTPAPSAPSLKDLTPAILPTSRLDVPWWAARHNAIVEQVRAHRDFNLLLIGDSITQNYEKANPPDENFQPTWKQFYEPRRALNLGFSGDSTANLLWRLTHGEIDGLRPQAAIVLIGTNNTGHEHQTAEQTEAGIGNVVGTLTQRLPQTRILILGILPSDVSPEKTAADKAVNAWLAKRYGSKSTPPATSTANTATGATATANTTATGTTDTAKTTTTGATATANTATATSPNQECVISTEAKRSGETCGSPSTSATTANGTQPPQNTAQTDPRVTYLDIGDIFLNADGTLNTAIFYDPRLPHPGKPLHPDTTGQRKMAEAIEPTLAKLMYDKPRTTTTPAPTPTK